jgi:hypothetical protein
VNHTAQQNSKLFLKAGETDSKQKDLSKTRKLEVGKEGGYMCLKTGQTGVRGDNRVRGMEIRWRTAEELEENCGQRAAFGLVYLYICDLWGKRVGKVGIGVGGPRVIPSQWAKHHTEHAKVPSGRHLERIEHSLATWGNAVKILRRCGLNLSL